MHGNVERYYTFFGDTIDVQAESACSQPLLGRSQALLFVFTRFLVEARSGCEQGVHERKGIWHDVFVMLLCTCVYLCSRLHRGPCGV